MWIFKQKKNEWRSKLEEYDSSKNSNDEMMIDKMWRTDGN